jgi:hypothetical protein
VVGYHGRIDTAWVLSLERLSGADPAAVQLLELAAFLAPEPVPLSLIHDHAAMLGEPLRTAAADPDILADTLGALVGYSLARRHADGFQVHRLVQAVVRHRLPTDRQHASAHRAVALLAAASPGDPENPANWAGYTQLAPHVLAAGPRVDASPAGRQLVLDTAQYLWAHGDRSGSRAVCEQVLHRWRAILGPDHPDSLTVASRSSLALSGVGEVEPARALGEDTLQRCRRTLGPDHPTTLVAAAGLMHSLAQIGQGEPARDLGRDTLRRCRRVLGPDHPITLWASAALIMPLALSLGQAEPARALGEDTLQRCRRTLGPDHPTTLLAACMLTGALVLLGEADPAHALGQDTLQRCHRVLGPEPSITLTTAVYLAFALSGVGEAEPARALGEDTLQRCRRLFGPDHAVTLCAATSLTLALIGLGETEPARALGEDTLQRYRRVLGPDNPITRYVTQAVSSGHLLLNGDEHEDHRVGHCERSLHTSITHP